MYKLKLIFTFLFIGVINIALAQTDDYKSLVEGYIEDSKVSISDELYYKARTQLDDALKEAKNSNDKALIANVYYEIGNLLLFLEENNSAIISFKKAIIKQEPEADKKPVAKSYSGMAKAYFNDTKYQIAIKYYKIAYDYFDKNGNELEKIQVALYKGISHYKLDEFQFAIDDFDRCQKYATRNNKPRILSRSLLYKGHILARLIDLDKGRRQCYKGFIIAEENNFTDVLAESYYIISEVEELEGNRDKSIKYLKRHINFNDSLRVIKRSKLSTIKRSDFISKDNTEFHVEKVENIDELQSTKEKNKVTIMLSVALITMLSLFSISLYKNNTLRKKNNKALYKSNKELKKAKEKAEQLTKAKANFLSTVTHELRTPLYAVTGLTSMLIEENPKAEQLDNLKSLKFSGDYLLTFINDILEVNKIEAQKVDIDNQVLNLKNKIQNIINALNISQTNNIKLHLEYDKSLPLFFAIDEVKISQILINLIGNSVKFTKNGDIWVRLINLNQDNKKYNIRFEVEDNGIGISQEKQKSIFESFSQGSVEINRKYGGTGLGLSIVRGLVDILGGQIQLESSINKGTKFFFDINLTEGEEVIVSERTEYFKHLEKDELDKIMVLIVEDNKINQMITKKTLSKMMINCDIVENGEDAVEAVKSNKYNVVLMDIHMPGISGVEATKQIRVFDKELIIFALTAVTIDDHKQEFDEAGFTSIISKPFKQEIFERTLYQSLVKSNIINNTL